jgi:hypothetical protein
MKKIDFIFIFLTVLLFADYVTTVLGLSIGFIEKNDYVSFVIGKLTGNWLFDLSILFLLKLLVLTGLYKIATLPQIDISRSAISVGLVLIVIYSVILINNVTLIASAEKYCEFSDCKNVLPIGFAANGFATFSGSGDVGFPLSDKTGEKTLITVKVTNPKLVKEIHIYSDDPNFYKAQFRKWNDQTQQYDYVTVTGWGETYDLIYNNTDYGDAFVYHTSGQMDIYFVWENSIKNLDFGIELSAVRKSVWAYNFPDYSFFKLGLPKHCDKTYGSFDDSDFQHLIKLRADSCNSYCSCGVGSENKYIEQIPDISSATIVYQVEGAGTLEFCTDEVGNYINAFEVDTNVNFKWINYNSGAEIKNGTGYGDLLISTVPAKLIINNVFTFSAINESCIGTSQVSKDQIIFLFVDAQNDALLDSVSFNLTGSDFSDFGVYDYKVTYTSDQLTEGNQYHYSAERTGYFGESGSFVFTGGQVIKIFLKPKTHYIHDERNFTALSFMVYDAETNKTIPNAQVVVRSGGSSFVVRTNENGYVWVEAAKNNTYEFIVSAEGYYSIKDSVWVGKDPVHVDVYLPPVEGGTGTGGVSGGQGGGFGNITVPQTQQEAEEQILAALWRWGTMIVWFALMITFMNVFGMIRLPFSGRRRRR